MVQTEGVINDIPKKILVVDDFLSKTLSDTIETEFKDKIDWTLGDTVKGSSGVGNKYFRDRGFSNIYEQFQFNHMFLRKDFYSKEHITFEPNFFPIILPPLTEAISKIGISTTMDQILRIKANLQTKAPKESHGLYNLPHIDTWDEKNNFTLIYYVNDSDGDTFFFNEPNPKTEEDFKNLTIHERVTPKKGRAVIFRSDFLHSGSHPIENEMRIIINYNFYAYKIVEREEKIIFRE